MRSPRLRRLRHRRIRSAPAEGYCAAVIFGGGPSHPRAGAPVIAYHASSAPPIKGWPTLRQQAATCHRGPGAVRRRTNNAPQPLGQITTSCRLPPALAPGVGSWQPRPATGRTSGVGFIGPRLKGVRLRVSPRSPCETTTRCRHGDNARIMCTLRCVDKHNVALRCLRKQRAARRRVRRRTSWTPVVSSLSNQNGSIAALFPRGGQQASGGESPCPRARIAATAPTVPRPH
jgi:hypothetical protein